MMHDDALDDAISESDCLKARLHAHNIQKEQASM